MVESGRNFVSRWPQSWLGRAVWIMIGIAAFWVAYRFGSNYMACRADAHEKAGCVVIAFYVTMLQVVTHVVGTVIKIATLILP